MQWNLNKPEKQTVIRPPLKFVCLKDMKVGTIYTTLSTEGDYETDLYLKVSETQSYSFAYKNVFNTVESQFSQYLVLNLIGRMTFNPVE
jgi:hypothetical protein